MIRGTALARANEIIFEFCKNFFQPFVKLIEIYKNWEEIVLKIFKFFSSFCQNYFDVFEELNEVQFCTIIHQVIFLYPLL